MSKREDGNSNVTEIILEEMASGGDKSDHYDEDETGDNTLEWEGKRGDA